MPTGGPIVKRRRLAGDLRAWRNRVGLTIDEVAEQLEWSPAKISRIENARVKVLPRDVKFLLRAYGVPAEGGEWERLLALARGSHQKGWWNAYGDTLSESFQTYVGLEADAAVIRVYEPEYVPDLLQTVEYAWAVIGCGMLTAAEEEVENGVRARMARQSSLAIIRPPKLHAVVSEAVIRRPVGGPKLMRAQLSHLLDMGAKPGTTLQVLPFNAGAHPGVDGAFTILGFPEAVDSEVVYTRSKVGSLFHEQPGEQDRHKLIFNRLCAVALAPDKSRRLIAQAIDDLPSHPPD